MASFACFVNYVQQAAAASNFGTLGYTELRDQLSRNGMKNSEIEEAITVLRELYAARLRQVKKKRLSRQEQGIVDAVYGNGGLNPNQQQQFEDIAKVLGIPTISTNELSELTRMAREADNREGSEKALIEEGIRNILDQKNADYVARLNSAKISFKVLLSIGFNVMSYISNQKKLFENYTIQRVRFANMRGKGIVGVFDPFPLKDHWKFTQEFSNAMSKAVRGTTEETDARKRLSAYMGFASNALLGPTATIGADLNTYSDALEHGMDNETGLWGNIKKLDRNIAKTGKRWLSSVDAEAKVKLGDVFYFNERFSYHKENNPGLTDVQLIKMVTDEMFSVPYNQAVAEAEVQFIQWGITDSNGNVNKNSNRFKVRVGEIMRKGRDVEAMKRAFDTASSKVWQARMTFPSMKNDPYDTTKFRQRLDSGFGGVLADLLNSLRNTVSKAVGQDMVSQGFVFSLFGFVNGAAAYWQDFMEHTLFYGGYRLTKFSLMEKTGRRRLLDPKSRMTEEQARELHDKIIEMQGKVLIGLTETALIMALGAVANQFCDEKGEGFGGGGFTDFVTPDKPQGPTAVKANVEMQRPESSLSFCGGKVSIPLEYLGGFTIGNTKFLASMVDQLKNRDENFMSAVMNSMWLIADPNISPLLSSGPSPITSGKRIMELYSEASKKGEGYSTFYSVMERELSATFGGMATRMIPLPARVLKEVQQPFIPYRTYMPAGVEGEVRNNGLAGIAQMLYQTGIQTVYSVGNSMGVNQLMQMNTTTDGLVGKPVFDYRHRPVDLGNLYDGKSIAGLTKPLRDLYDNAKGKPLTLYDERDHFLAINDVAIPWDSRVYTVIHKDEPDKRRQLTDDEYYNYTYAYTKAFGEWYNNNYETLKAYEKPKNVRTVVTRRLGEIKRSILASMEENNKLSGEDLYGMVEANDAGDEPEER